MRQAVQPLRLQCLQGKCLTEGTGIIQNLVRNRTSRRSEGKGAAAECLQHL